MTDFFNKPLYKITSHRLGESASLVAINTKSSIFSTN